jgi:XamI-like restriction endonuclease
VPSDNQDRGVNRTKPDRWKADILCSVDMYNDWFLKFAPAAYRETGIKTTKEVESTLVKTENLTNVRAAVLKQEPSVLPTLRMSTCPPLAVDRLIGLAGVPRNLVGCMEEGSIPLRMNAALLEKD